MTKNYPKYWYRTTKFDPAKRNESGHFPLDNKEWTDFEDYSDPNYTFENYLLTENAYIYTVYYFIEKNKAENFQLYSVEKKAKRAKNSKIFSEQIHLEYTCRKILRNQLWCRIRSENMCIHFGWDYYMFIGSNYKCDITELEFGGIKMYIEPIDKSPYATRFDLL